LRKEVDYIIKGVTKNVQVNTRKHYKYQEYCLHHNDDNTRDIQSINISIKVNTKNRMFKHNSFIVKMI